MEGKGRGNRRGEMVKEWAGGGEGGIKGRGELVPPRLVCTTPLPVYRQYSCR